MISLNIRRLNLALLPQFLGQVPADGLALAVGVGRDEDVVHVLRRFLQLLDDLDAVRQHDVFGLEIRVDVDAELALREVADVSHGRDDLVVTSEIFADRLRLGRRFDDDECLGHVSLYQ